MKHINGDAGLKGKVMKMDQSMKMPSQGGERQQASNGKLSETT